ncbi:hypothetical protein ACERK3_16340 [Phycisphaerales bacterium AB-hyl4]|uniref:PEP-CTERM protein-sorting domain-containing protein n=1 Tax=Natronomicrosphaera hydrolytica TaxID=3242702 RepID=A0ABV4UA13_9BACT
MLTSKSLVSCLVATLMAATPLFGGQLVSVDGPEGFGDPPANTGFNLYTPTITATGDTPVDAVFTVTQTCSTTGYLLIVDLKTPLADLDLIGLTIEIGFGSGETFTRADWPALTIGGQTPMLSGNPASNYQDNYAIWNTAIGDVFNEYSPISLVHALTVPDPDAAFIPHAYQIYENENLVGYEFTLRYTPIFVPEPTSSSVLLLGLAGLASGRPSRMTTVRGN